MNTNQTFESAASRYQDAVGEGAMLPSRALSEVRNGTWHLRNIRGPLAIVTARGTVMDRIGGQRIGDKDSPSQALSEAVERIAQRASAALDGGFSGEPLITRVARLEAVLREIGRLADAQADALGFVPVRSPQEWGEVTHDITN
jgi:hypothetical protein